MDSSPGSDDVPKLPRGRGMKLSTAQLIRIVGTALLLVMLIVMQKPCADAVSGSVTSSDGSAAGSATRAMPKPGNVDLPRVDNGSASDYERLTPTMSEAEMKAAVERAKAKARAEQGSAAPAPAPAPKNAPGVDGATP